MTGHYEKHRRWKTTNTYLQRKNYISFAVEPTIMQSALMSAVIKWYYSHHSYAESIMSLFPWNLHYWVQALPYCNSCMYTASYGIL